MASIDQRGALDVLTVPRLFEIAETLGLGLAPRLRKAELAEAIARSRRAPLPRILELLRRDELKAICRAFGIDDSGRVKADIADRLLGRGQDHGAGTLTKAELVEAVAAVTGLLKKDADAVVNATLATMVESLRDGSKIEIRGFGSFRLRDRQARIGRNPRTGAEVKLPAKRVCYFKPGKTLKQILS